MKQRQIRIGDTIKIIASHPAVGQIPIDGLIGQSFEVISCGRDADDRRDGTVSVDAGGDWGQIVLQPSEYTTT